MNDRVRVRSVEILAQGWATFKRYVLDFRRLDGVWEEQKREIYDQGDGATILPLDPARGTVLLVRQFRLPAHVAGADPFLLEACAGKLDGDNPEACVRREAEEEMGVRLRSVRPLYGAFMSPGSVTERIWFFLGDYEPSDRIAAGGGVEGEHEDIEVIEMTLDEALAATRDGRIIDAKTIVLIQQLALERATERG